jgi:hypothetical protein
MTGHAGGRGRSRGHTEDRPRSADVRVHAGLGDPEQAGDLLRRKAAGYGAEHLTLTIGQRGDRTPATRENASRNDVSGEHSDQRGSRALHPYGQRLWLAPEVSSRASGRGARRRE